MDKHALVPHLSDEARLWALLVEALPAGDQHGVVSALLRRQALEEGVRRLGLFPVWCQRPGACALRWGGYHMRVAETRRHTRRGGGEVPAAAAAACPVAGALLRAVLVVLVEEVESVLPVRYSFPEGMLSAMAFWLALM